MLLDGNPTVKDAQRFCSANTAAHSFVKQIRVFGVRRQSEATTALWINKSHIEIQSSVGLRLPPRTNQCGQI